VAGDDRAAVPSQGDQRGRPVVRRSLLPGRGNLHREIASVR
jgi:hypothetical protein